MLPTDGCNRREFLLKFALPAKSVCTVNFAHSYLKVNSLLHARSCSGYRTALTFTAQSAAHVTYVYCPNLFFATLHKTSVLQGTDIVTKTNRRHKAPLARINLYSAPWNRPRRPRGRVEVQFYSFFNLGARWGWVPNATSRPLYPQERPATHCTGGWVGPRAGLNGCGKSGPHRDSIPGPSSP